MAREPGATAGATLGATPAALPHANRGSTIVTATLRLRGAPSEAPIRRWVESGALLLALFAIVGVRWVAVQRGVPWLVVGTGFAFALLGLWVATGRWLRPSPRRAAVGAAAGAVAGLALVIVTMVAPTIAGVGLPPGLGRPAAPWLPWALVTIAVASAEEGILRGVLFERLCDLRGLAGPLAGLPRAGLASAGLPLAVIVTTVAFALIHVPLYGWHVVPLDLAVGLTFAGLRLATGTVLAPAVAHAIADLATWWL